MVTDIAARARAAVEEKLTIPSIFLYATGRYDNPNAFLERAGDTFEAISTGEFREMVIDLSLGLLAAGVSKGEPIAIISENRVEWAAADLAISCAGAVTVPVSHLYSDDQLACVLSEAGVQRAFIARMEVADRVSGWLDPAGKNPSLFLIEGEPRGENIISLMELARMGRESYSDRDDRFMKTALSIASEDLSTIMFTSGTGGIPKMVRLSHRNIASNVIGASRALKVNADDRCLSFLPLSHAFERTAGFLTVFYNGASIAYAESINTLARDLRSVSPTILVSVPRLYEKMESSMTEDADAMSRPRKLIFNWAIDLAKRVAPLLAGRVHLPPSLRLQRSVADLLVYRTIRNRMGGRIRMLISGGAPLERETGELLYGCGLLILEGYGLTEASPICTVNRLDSFRLGSVGLPLPGTEIRIAEDGEVLVKGDHVMTSCLNPGLKAELPVEDGWLRTGDLGRIDEEGFLYLTGRKKELIVTSWGVHIAPAPIEQILKRSPYIRDALIVGNGHPYIGALIVPHTERIARHLGLHFETGSEGMDVLDRPEVHTLISAEIDRCTSHLSQEERIRRYSLIPREFSIEKGESTTTLKLVRSVIHENFAWHIESLYRDRVR